jgi:antitoxin ParD1/3/4
MPTRNINLTPQLDSFVDDKIRDGQYANASEVLRAGLRALEQGEREEQTKLEALRAAIDEGDACDPADDIDGETLRRLLHQRIEDREAGARVA